ncbi:prepilin peptidase [bacterium]|nr:prepilin peptidase [bacterium]
MNIILFIIGACFGSFAQCIQSRILTDKKGLVYKRSQCPTCKNTLKALDLIPLISFIVQKAKCRYCLNKISWQYPLVELIFAIAAVLLATSIGFYATLVLIPLLTILLALAIQDLKNMYVDSFLLYSFAFISFLYGLLFFKYSILNILIWGLVGYIFFYLQELISAKKWVGSADAFIGMSIGFLFASFQTLETIIISYWIATIILVPYYLIKKRNLKGIKFGFIPYLALSIYIQLLI